MIEIDVRGYLASALSIPVFVGEKPAEKHKNYVVIEVLDAGRQNLIDAVTLSIKSYADTLLNAATLNSKVRAEMFELILLSNISASKCTNGGGQSIESSSKEYCYECIFNITYMED